MNFFDVDDYTESKYTEIASKSVEDSDGFLTDYTMYRDVETGEYVFVYGDKDIYSPDDEEFDWSCDSEAQAWEWFNDYHGFSNDDTLDLTQQGGRGIGI